MEEEAKVHIDSARSRIGARVDEVEVASSSGEIGSIITPTLKPCLPVFVAHYSWLLQSTAPGGSVLMYQTLLSPFNACAVAVYGALVDIAITSRGWGFWITSTQLAARVIAVHVDLESALVPQGGSSSGGVSGSEEGSYELTPESKSAGSLGQHFLKYFAVERMLENESLLKSVVGY
ncbi:hypothetical protein GQ600_490 [Phytophthora cactorum]|nr:hypothetical protein GQ600_490 [Phytophthora cactorum]